MSTELYEQVVKAVRHRRIIPPEQMNGKVIPENIMQELIELAQWAPTHGLNEPWRFTVFSGDGRHRFARQHARMFDEETEESSRKQGKYEKILHRADNASHVIAIGVKCGTKPNIPDIEEIASVSCGVQNIMLAACTLGIACYWGTGGMTYHPKMKQFLGLEENDKLIGFLYMGYSDMEWPVGKRSGMKEKVKFVSS